MGRDVHCSQLHPLFHVRLFEAACQPILDVSKFVAACQHIQNPAAGSVLHPVSGTIWRSPCNILTILASSYLFNFRNTYETGSLDRDRYTSCIYDPRISRGPAAHNTSSSAAPEHIGDCSSCACLASYRLVDDIVSDRGQSGGFECGGSGCSS